MKKIECEGRSSGWREYSQGDGRVVLTEARIELHGPGIYQATLDINTLGRLGIDLKRPIKITIEQDE